MQHSFNQIFISQGIRGACHAVMKLILIITPPNFKILKVFVTIVNVWPLIRDAYVSINWCLQSLLCSSATRHSHIIELHRFNTLSLIRLNWFRLSAGFHQSSHRNKETNKFTLTYTYIHVYAYIYRDY